MFRPLEDTALLACSPQVPGKGFAGLDASDIHFWPKHLWPVQAEKCDWFLTSRTNELWQLVTGMNEHYGKRINF